MILYIYIYITVIFIYVYIYIYISYTCTYRQSHIYHYIHDYDMHGFICYSKARGLKRRGVTSAVLSSNAFLLRACHCQSVFFVHCVYILYVRVYVHAQYSLTCVCVRVHFKFKRKAGSSAEVYWLDFEEYVSIIQEASEGIGSWISRIIVILVIEGSLEVKLPTIWTVEKQR